MKRVTLLLALCVIAIFFVTAVKAQQEDDQDDFEIEEAEPPKKPRHVPAPADLTGAKPKRVWVRLPDTFEVEITAGVLLVLYGVNFYYGRRYNERAAKKWGAAVFPVLEKNFSSLRDGRNRTLVKESQSIFKIYASGRVYCEGLLASLRLRNRQDLASYITAIAWPSNDQYVIEILMDERMPPMVLCVCQRRLLSKIREVHTDVSTLAHSVPCEILNKKLTVVTDSPSAVDSIITRSVAAMLNGPHAALFESVVVSDQNEFQNSKHKRMIRFVFRMPRRLEDYGEIAAAVKLACRFIDLVYRAKVSERDRAEVEKTREKLSAKDAKTEHEKRQDAAQRRKHEKRLAEAKRIGDLTPEQQRRAEERAKKIENRRKMGKMRVKMTTVAK